MTNEIVQVIGGITVILGSIIGSFLAARASIRRVPAQNTLDENQAASLAVQSLKLLIEPLNTKILELESQVDQVNKDFKKQVDEMNGTYHIEMELTVGKNPMGKVVTVKKVNAV